MNLFRLVAISAFMASSLAAYEASALTVDETTGISGGASSNLSDPDDKIPFPHVADDGSQSDNFQAQPVGNSGVSFGFTAPSNDNGGNAFQRAQERMQQ